MFSWGEREQLKPLPEMIDKNHPLYYGPTDYNFKVCGPLTIDDLREFLLEYKQEQGAAGETEIETKEERAYKEAIVIKALGPRLQRVTKKAFLNWIDNLYGGQ